MTRALIRRGLVTFAVATAVMLAGPVRAADAARNRCCLPNVGCKLLPAKRCTKQGGTNIGPGTCAPDSCAGGTTTTTVATTTTTVATTTTTVATTTTTVATTTTTVATTTTTVATTTTTVA